MLTQRRYIFLIITVCILFTGCVLVSPRPASKEQVANISIFIEAEESKSDIILDITSAGIISTEGKYIEILSNPLTLRSTEIKKRQLLLGERKASEGYYTALKFVISRALLIKDGEPISLDVNPGGYKIPIGLNIRSGRDTRVFLVLNPDASIKDNQFEPRIYLRKIRPGITAAMVYVTDEASDSVSVINMATGEMAETIRVGKRPRGIATSPVRIRKRLYVANYGSNNISIIDASTNRVENHVPIRFGKGPTGITSVRVSGNSELILVTAYDSGIVSIINGTTFQEMDRIPTGQGPVYITGEPDVETILGSKFLSYAQIDMLRGFRDNFVNVYVANEMSNSLTILKINTQTLKCEEVNNVEVGWRPVFIHIDYPRARVYVANYGASSITVVDIIEVVKGNINGAVTQIHDIGINVHGIISDPGLDRLYILKEDTGEIEILRLITNDFNRLSSMIMPVMGRIKVGDLPRSMIFDEKTGKIYVVNSASGTISVVDRISRRQEFEIKVGKRPYGIAIFR